MLQLCYEKFNPPAVNPSYLPVDFIQDIEGLRSAIQILSRIRKNVDRIVYVESAYQEFIDLQSATHSSTRTGQIALERKARSFFLEFDIFLDHWQKYIAHHERMREYKELFKQLTHNAFDSSDDYAMATMLRNYVTHASDVIQATFWGESVFEVGCFKDILLQDNTFNDTKKEIIKRQSAKFIPLNPIMTGALEKLKVIQDALVRFDIDDGVKKAAGTVSEAIDLIKEQGEKKWVLIDEDAPDVMILDKNGKLIEIAKGKFQEDFLWKEYEELVARLKGAWSKC